MKRRLLFWFKTFLLILLMAGLAALTGCSGDDGAQGPRGLPGKDATLDPLATVAPESCVICHVGGTGEPNGDSHQADYGELFQEGVVVVDPASVAYSYDGVGLTHTVTFQMTKNSVDFDCTQADTLSIAYADYTAASRSFTAPDTDAPADGFGNRVSLKGTVTYTAATNTCTNVIADDFGDAHIVLGDLSGVDGLIAVYGEDEQIDSVGHIRLGKYPFAAILETGAGVDYVSAANVTGCEKCHTVPYYKHGYIIGDVGLGVGNLDFYTCKVCHIDNGHGGHTAWQYSVDDPQGWATGAAESHDYTYTTRLMNDVHMSHAMEFPYPQSMRNCNTCHAGKLTETLSDTNFTLETCRSCHPVTGGTDTADANGDFAVDTTGMALSNLLPAAIHGGLDLYDNATVCNGCHITGNLINAPLFSDIHSGYDPLIYDEATGAKYADTFTASIDSVTVSGTDLSIQISATGGPLNGLNATDIIPHIQVSFYGYDTKDFILSNHTRDANGNRMEKTIGTANPLFTEDDADGSDGTWAVTLHMANYVPDDPTNLGSIPQLIADGTVKKAEVAFLPELDHPTITIVDHSGNTVPAPVGLNAPSVTVDVTADAVDPFVADYYSGDNAIVSVEGDAAAGIKGCNSCHDQLAISFHSGDRGGNIVVCRMCHVVTSGGSHLEGQSRSIDSYTHAIHRFEAFDIEDIDFNDPVEKAKYEEHIEFLFPDFAIINCMACHEAGKFNVPDQSKSMPGLLSATDEIPNVIPLTTPAVVVGPAARACGACHRAQFIKEDDTSGFAAFNKHTKDFGYRVENDANDHLLYDIIKLIMGLF
jgi:OmcA/MtrC family decaheme c-type cytochrome